MKSGIKKISRLKNENKNNEENKTFYHKAKKSLGQNFLKSKEAIRGICDAGRVTEGEIVVEIGPGKGVLTEELLKRGAMVIAIEKDTSLIEFLSEKFEEEIKNKKLILINDDILNIFLPEIFLKFFSGPRTKGTGSVPDHSKNLEISQGDSLLYKIIANIPYNITGAIIKKFLSEVENKPTLMALLVQKEVAERIVARDGKESILSLSVKAYAEPKYIMKVSKKYFNPAPKVDSAIILIDNISNNNFKNKKEEDFFFKIIKAGFAHKRKVLIKNLETNLTIDKEILSKIFKKINMDEKSRSEDLNLEKWKTLTIEILACL